MAAQAKLVGLLKWVGIVLAVLVLLAILVWAAARLTGPTTSQRAALQTMQLPGEPPGRNGYAALWLLPYDVPIAMQEAVLAEDVEVQAARPAWPDVPDPQAPVEPFEGVAAERYPDLRSEDDRLPKHCGWRDRDCLERVEADGAGFTALVERDAALIARVERLAGFDYFRSPFRPAMDMPIPAFQPLAYTLSSNALDFANGEVDRALSSTCRDAATARKLISNPDSLVASMVGTAMLQGSAYLFADMLSRLPLDHPVPPACASALAPPSQGEFEVCDAMRQEYRFTSQGLTGVAPQATPMERVAGRLMYDEEKTRALTAEGMARWCSREVSEKVALDIPATVDLAQVQRPLWSLSCLDNAIGCILARIAAPAYGDYQKRLQDAAARLHVVRMLLELRRSPPAPELLAERIGAFGEEEHPDSPRTYRLSGDGGAIEVSMFERARSEPWRVPLPEALRPPPTTTATAPAPAPAQ